MYNEKILNALNNLPYLSSLKNSTVTATSKKNQFGDTVKFFVQIGEGDIINKIAFKASGCTYFLVFCNYFCQLVEGKTVKDALKINGEKLESFVELEDSRKHVIDIILATFALLVKKYNKQVNQDNKNKDNNKSVLKKGSNVKDKDTTKNSVKKETVTIIDSTNPNSIKQADNIIALNSLVKTSKHANVESEKLSETQQKQVSTLSKMINKMSHKTDEEKKEENVGRLNHMQDSLNAISAHKGKKLTKKVEKSQKKQVKKANKKK